VLEARPGLVGEASARGLDRARHVVDPEVRARGREDVRPQDLRGEAARSAAEIEHVPEAVPGDQLAEERVLEIARVERELGLRVRLLGLRAGRVARQELGELAARGARRRGERARLARRAQLGARESRQRLRRRRPEERQGPRDAPARAPGSAGRRHRHIDQSRMRSRRCSGR
jgi:hypothetical protein